MPLRRNIKFLHTKSSCDSKIVLKKCFVLLKRCDDREGHEVLSSDEPDEQLVQKSLTRTELREKFSKVYPKKYLYVKNNYFDPISLNELRSRFHNPATASNDSWDGGFLYCSLDKIEGVVPIYTEDEHPEEISVPIYADDKHPQENLPIYTEDEPQQEIPDDLLEDIFGLEDCYKMDLSSYFCL